MNDDANEHDAAGDFRINNRKTTTSRSFRYKTIIENMPVNYNTLDTEIAAPLKYLSNFWRSLIMLLINCEIELDFT